MKERLLIVDDEERTTSAFTAELADEGLEVLVANSSEAAIELARQQQPEYATIDFSIDERDGNAVGAALREAVPGIVMAGVTGGDPRSYDDALFAIRESKVNAQEPGAYGRLVRALREKEPAKAYFGEQDLEQLELVSCLYILVQGYNIGTRRLSGEQPIPGVELPPIEQETVRSFLADSQMEEMLQAAARVLPAKDDPQLARFYETIRDGDVEQLDLEVTKHAEQMLYKALGGE